MEDVKQTEDVKQIELNIIELFKKYKDDEYMFNRLQTHLENLPTVLEQENKRHEERMLRINELNTEQENFYKVFLSKHRYYYMPYNNIYYEYDGKTYKIVKDDDIHHNLLSTITDEGKLIQWKHKTKQNIIKQIKDRSLFKTTPETYTIQNVLKFLQTIFETKTESKYFLTVIGDCILKKNVDTLMFFVSSNVKKLVTLIDSIAYVTTGNSIMNNFVTKYHDNHKISLYRLINTNDLNLDIVKDSLNNIGIDLLCVASHYSECYTNSDNYLNTKADENIKKHILHFVFSPLDKVLDDFICQCIETVTVETNITWKNMHYIWKLYLNSINIPNMIYSTQLQQILATRLENNNDNGSLTFTHVTSKYLPNVSSFLSFWDKHIIVSNDTNFDDEYEIDELITLYKTTEQNGQINESTMIKMICHYYSPQVEVIDNKYITNIKCNLWSKQDDIDDFLEHHKHTLIQTNNLEQQLISFDDLYQDYKTYFKSKGILDQKVLPIVSKHFFEKYVTNKLTNFITFDKFVSSIWLQH